MMFKALLISGMMVAALVAYKIYFPSPNLEPSPWTECDRGVDEIAAESPDQKWVARGITLGCGEMAAAVDWDNIVIVRKGAEPTIGDEVLVGDWRKMGDVKLQWKQANNLSVILPSDAKIYRQNRKLGDIVVEIELDQVNPAGR